MPDTRSQHRNTKAGQALASFMKRAIRDGCGNKGVAWQQKNLAFAAALKPSLLSGITKGSRPSDVAMDGLERAFFPDPIERQASNSMYAAWASVKSLLTHEREGAPGLDDIEFSARQVWDVLLAPIRKNSVSVIREGGDGFTSPTFDPQQISLEWSGKAFSLPMPAWFVEWANGDGSGEKLYDIHAPSDFSGSGSLEHFYDTVPIPGLRQMVERHSETYAKGIRGLIESKPTFPPFNRPKTGLYSFQQPQPAGKAERAYMGFSLYRTNYFTHRVMREVTREVRRKSPHWFDAQGSFLDEPQAFVRYFTTSFGLNLLAMADGEHGTEAAFVRTSGNGGNVNQRGSIHVSVSEGMTEDDLNLSGQSDIKNYAFRALREELGVTDASQVRQLAFIEFAMEMVNFEPYVSGVAFLNMNFDQLRRARSQSARDERREQQDFFQVPFTDRGLVDLLLKNPNGTGDFTTFSLLIMDSLIAKGVVGR